MRAETNETEMKKMEKINKAKSWFFEEINSSRKKREGAQINKIRNEKGEVLNDTTEIQRIKRDNHKQLYAKKKKKLTT